MNGLDQIQAYEVHVFQGPDDGHTAPKRHSSHQVDIRCRRNVFLHKMNRLPPQSMKQAIADETGNLTIHSYCALADGPTHLTSAIQTFDSPLLPSHGSHRRPDELR